jgi:hypothetical protein
MTEVLVVLAAFAAFGICGFLTTVGIMRWRLSRRNRVDPMQPSPAPVRWLASPSEPARLHRRLQTVARVSVADPEIDDHSTGEILAVATRLDRRAVIAAVAPSRERRLELSVIRTEVVQLEGLTRRLARPLAGPPGHPELDTLRLLAEAREDIEALDRSSHPD